MHLGDSQHTVSILEASGEAVRPTLFVPPLTSCTAGPWTAGQAHCIIFAAPSDCTHLLWLLKPLPDPMGDHVLQKIRIVRYASIACLQSAVSANSA